MKRLAIGAVVAGLVAAAAVALPRYASAAETHTNCIQFDQYGNFIGLTSNCSETIHGVSGPPPAFPAVNPCNGDTGTLYLNIAESVYHITVNGAGDAWDTGTSTGTALFAPDNGADPSGSGTFTNWFGDEFNAQNSVQPSTFSVVIHLSDGATATVHMISNTVFTPNGAEVTVNEQQADCS